LTQDRYRSHRELLARATICALFTLLSVNLLRGYLQTGRVTGLLLLVSEFLVVVLTFARRPAGLVDRSPGAAVVTLISVVSPLLLRVSDDETGLLPDAATAGLLALGLVVVVVGKMTLGRSFGLVPANRGVVVAGPYAFVRHPIYSGYLVTHVGFLLAHPRIWNIALVVVADVALIVRALVEERVLDHDESYRAYCQRVGWHFVPGLF
jgi:protein-S-isoprenylcysteine O-methyltransferase Ste14